MVVTDKDGSSGESVYQYIVVNDPEGGFVTGGGWIESTVGAYSPNPYVSGKANFGFNARYKKDTSIPTGQTQFRFAEASLDFHSTAYEWLVIAGARAQYKGVGVINSEGNYGFIVTVIDGDIDGVVDRIRIKIWDSASGDVIYDSQIGAPDQADPELIIAGGSITVH